MNKLITPGYVEQNAALHEQPGYGSSGHLWLGHIVELAKAVNLRSLIDYGAGKGTLGNYLGPYGIAYTLYDPATFPTLPDRPADMVVALDVMEHIEPDYVQAVMQHIGELTRKVVFLHVSTRPATKKLSDGRNAHLIVQDWYWWKPVITQHFKTVRIRQNVDSFEFVGTPNRATRLTTHEIHKIKGH